MERIRGSMSCPQSLAPFALLALSPLVLAQANAVPGLDIRLSNMRSLDMQGRAGVFPNGMNGLALETTVCNEGTVDVPWFEPMNPAHPKIAFLIASVRNGRIEQLSGESYVKHGFFAVNANGCQATCMRPQIGNIGEYLGVGCSDTYATINNGDNYYLGPPEEVDPWLGTWDRRCSFFDRGFPDVGAPANCDGRRSLTHQAAANLGPVNSRVQVSDEDLILGGTLCFQGQYVVEGLSEAGRDNSLGSRTFSASWTGNRWELSPTSGLLHGTVLQRWPDALVTSNTNGNDDGRVYVAMQVTGPVEGFYHYEYALHNRDAARGVSGLRIPFCPGARVRAAGFRDVDRDANTDWSAALKGDELVFAHRGVAQHWNTIFNFWFDCDAAPADAAVTIESGEPLARLSAFEVPSRAPLALYNAYLGAGCASGRPPSLFAAGNPPRANLGNANFALASTGNAPLEPHFLFLGRGGTAPLFQGCRLWTGTLTPVLVSSVLSDVNGYAQHASPIPNNVALEGRALALQAVGRVPGAGVLFRDYVLTDGLLVRIGDTLPGCP
jgi:hypothetical protein